MTLSLLQPDELRHAEQRAARRVFEFSQDFLGSVDHDGCFTALNPAWETKLGFPREYLVGRPFMEFVHPADREATKVEFARLEAGGAGSGSSRIATRSRAVAGAGSRGGSSRVRTVTASSPAT